MKRLGEFIRSVIPVDPFQLFFLGGVVCLIAAHGLRWQPAGLHSSGQSAGDLGLWLQYSAVFFIYLIIFSGMAGYFVCFWPGKHPVRRVLCFVCAPALLGLDLMFARILYLTETSVLESVPSTFGHKFRLAEATLWKLPEGFQITLFGLLLIAIFISRMAFGIASLPVTLRSARISRGDPEAWQHLQILVFILVGPFFLVGLLFSIPFLVSTRLLVYAQSMWFGRLDPALESVVALAVLLCIIRRADRQTILESIRWPDRISVLLSLIFPVGTGVLISVGNFLVDRTLWAAHDFWRLSPPEFGSYFDIPDPYFLLLIFAAFFEEIIFRGLLQNRFIQRYGMYRGLFFVGIVWAAFHFFSDFSFSRAADLMILEHIGMRMCMCMTLSYVLGWLSLRSRSVIPATLAHALYNMLVFSGFGPLFPGKDIVRVSLWAVLAWVLFRYWPVEAEGSSELAPGLRNPESAV